jgi:hypothetical protein
MRAGGEPAPPQRAEQRPETVTAPGTAFGDAGVQQGHGRAPIAPNPSSPRGAEPPPGAPGAPPHTAPSAYEAAGAGPNDVAASPPAGQEPSAATAPPSASDGAEPAPAGAPAARAAQPGFRERGRMRRRLQFLRRARELAYRDLGGLVFNLHRFGRRNDELVLAKLGVLERLDAELRGLESALRDHQTTTVLRVPGITACARCAAIHASDDRFCPNCGLPMGRHPDLPIAGPPVQATAPDASPGGPAQAGAPAPAPAQPPLRIEDQLTAEHAAPPARPSAGETTEILRPPQTP